MSFDSIIIERTTYLYLLSLKFILPTICMLKIIQYNCLNDSYPKTKRKQTTQAGPSSAQRRRAGSTRESPSVSEEEEVTERPYARYVNRKCKLSSFLRTEYKEYKQQLQRLRETLTVQQELSQHSNQSSLHLEINKFEQVHMQLTQQLQDFELNINHLNQVVEQLDIESLVNQQQNQLINLNLRIKKTIALINPQVNNLKALITETIGIITQFNEAIARHQATILPLFPVPI
ncbi:MAG: hypothetical protein EXX96DRAFT_535924 [Benjaminiella poitrasii]|nr:MAG: hypothetical protein EXX96DRAFT_535924 [Benjaminiella poitrasii]